MIVDANMISAATSSVSPIPTVVPGPTIIYQTAGEAGKTTLWIVTVTMFISSLVFYALAFRVPAPKRLFHVLTAFITTFAFLSYYAMANGDGISFHPSKETVSHKHGLPDTEEITYRQVYWARYADWSVTTPLLLLDLSLLAGLAGANILVAIVADLIMIMTGLFAAYGTTNTTKWGWYLWSCLAYLVIVYQVVWNGRTAAASKDNKTKTFFASLAAFTFFLWTIYPIVWGFADGARIVGVDTEIISYAILDVLAKPVFGAWLIFTHDRMASTSPSLEGFWSDGWRQGSLRVGDDDEA